MTSSIKNIHFWVYTDDLSVCNNFGTFRKAHEIAAVYWVLLRKQVLLHSALNTAGCERVLMLHGFVLMHFCIH